MQYPKFLALVSGLASLAFATQVSAQIYQCKDAAGKTVFSQSPCSGAPGTTGKLLVAPAPKTSAATVSASPPSPASPVPPPKRPNPPPTGQVKL